MKAKPILKQFLLYLLLLTIVCPTTKGEIVLNETEAKYGGGTGEPNNPYQITTAEDLILLSESPEDYDKHFVLTADIDLDPNLTGGQIFTKAIIAPDIDVDEYYYHSTAFTGKFDGNGHTLSNLVIIDPNGEYLGLFGYIDDNGSVLNLYIDNINIKGLRHIGGIVGLSEGVIENCHVNSVIEGASIIGGVCGENIGAIRYSHANIICNGSYCNGGLLGRNGGKVVQCYATGQIKGFNDIGGLIGSNYNSVVSCYSWTNVRGRDFVGGLIGYDYGTITTSYAAGQVIGGSRTGGLTGLTKTTAFSSYWDWESSCKGSSASGKPKTTQEMQVFETFRGWGHDNAWVLDAGSDYPHLAWESTVGEPIVDEVNRYGSGTGEPNNPYEIWTAEQFSNIAWYLKDFDKHFVLMCDIDINDVDSRWVKPIGTKGNPFVGLFNGNMHTIRNFRYGIISTTEEQESEEINLLISRGRVPPSPTPEAPEITLEHQVGVFGVIGEICFYDDCPDQYNELRGVVKNLQIADANINGIYYIGGLAGINRGVVSACSTSGNVSGYRYIGGLIGGNGYLGKGLARTCYSVADVAGEYYIGGLVGSNGDWDGVGVVESCYAEGNVNSVNEAGGLVGYNEGTIVTSYSIGEITGNDRIGGLVGINSESCYLSYWDVNSSGIITSSTGQPKTTLQMQDILTFRGWGSQEHWTIDNGNDYPRLAWEGKYGEAIVDSQYAYGGGTGEQDNPYQIYTAEEFIEIAYRSADFNKHFVLMQDIDLSVVDPNWILPIGNSAFTFCGIFNGNNHTIYNFNYTSGRKNYIGIFGCVGPNVTDANASSGCILNLNIIYAKVAGSFYVGILAGNNQGTISSCKVYGNCDGVDYVGGVSGYNQSIIEQTHFAGEVTGGWAVGGLAGYNTGQVTTCASDSSVEARDSIGGLVGRNSNDISFCYSRGCVNGGERVGGLVGDNYGNIESCYSTSVVIGTKNYVGGLAGASWKEIAYCYSAGLVIGDDIFTGGLVGYGRRTFNSFWDIESSGQTTSNSENGRTTAEMQTESTFTDAGWDFAGETVNGTGDIWWILEGQDYPRLWWEAEQRDE